MERDIVEIDGRRFDCEIARPDLEDIKTWEMIKSADGLGLFQIETPSLMAILPGYQVKDLPDLSALIALYRPGPLKGGNFQDYIERKHGRQRVEYDHPKLEPVLRETLGIFVYQEQCIRASIVLAGFSEAEGDNFRKAIGKMKPEILVKEEEHFITGCISNGTDRETAKKVFDKIAAFAGYGFNRSCTREATVTDAKTGAVSKIGDLLDKKIDVLSYDREKLNWVTKSSVVEKTGVVECYQVKTKCGRELSISKYTPLLELKNGWTNVTELQKGQRIAISREEPIFGTEVVESHKIRLLGYIIGDAYTGGSIGFSNGDLDLVDDFTSCVEQFGCTVKQDLFGDYKVRPQDYEFHKYDIGKKLVEIREKRGESREDVERALRQIRGRRTGIKTIEDWGVVTNWEAYEVLLTYYRVDEDEVDPHRIVRRKGYETNHVYRWIEELGLEGCRAWEKFIPDFVFRLRKDLLREFIGALWATDGCVSRNGDLYYGTTSERLARQVSCLMTRFGFLNKLGSTDYFQRCNEKYHEYWVVSLSKLDVPRFAELFPFRGQKGRLLNSFRNLKFSKGSFSQSFDKIFFQDGSSKSRHLVLNDERFRDLRRLTRDPVYWDEIISIESIGLRDVYSIMDVDNFVANGVIKHNSHSVAYALVCYQMAYLKANYFIEFMAATLNFEGQGPRMKKYIDNCRKHGVMMLPPDVNESIGGVVIGRTRDGREGIRIGLGKIKGVGAKAVETIEQNRPYSSFTDFLNKIEKKAVHSGCLKALIEAGSFDTLGYTRKALVELANCALNHKYPKETLNAQLTKEFGLPIEGIELTREEIKRRFSEAKERIAPSKVRQELEQAWPGYNDALVTKRRKELDVTLSDEQVEQLLRNYTEEYSPPELAQKEIGLLSLFISAHPLEYKQEALNRIGPVTLEQLERIEEMNNITIVVAVEAIEYNPDRGRYDVEISDLSGHGQATMWSKTTPNLSIGACVAMKVSKSRWGISIRNFVAI